MKKLIIYISAFCLLAGGCVSSKKDTQKSDLQKETSKQETVKNGKQNSKDQKNNSKLTADQQRIKEEIEKNKQLEKEAKQRQKQEKKEAKKKQKEIDDLIKNATKNERKRIEEERKKEKEELLNSLKNKENKDTKDYASDIEEKEKTALTQNNNSADTVSLEDILGGDSTQNVNLAEVNEPESNSDIDKLAGKLLKKKDKTKQVQPEQIINLDSMSAMDKILFLMNDNNLNKTVSFNNTVKKVSDLTDSQKKKLINQDNDADY